MRSTGVNPCPIGATFHPLLAPFVDRSDAGPETAACACGGEAGSGIDAGATTTAVPGRASFAPPIPDCMSPSISTDSPKSPAAATMSHRRRASKSADGAAARRWRGAFVGAASNEAISPIGRAGASCRGLNRSIRVARSAGNEGPLLLGRSRLIRLRNIWCEPSRAFRMLDRTAERWKPNGRIGDGLRALIPAAANHRGLG
jgi:hypothetical protein